MDFDKDAAERALQALENKLRDAVSQAMFEYAKDHIDHALLVKAADLGKIHREDVGVSPSSKELQLAVARLDVLKYVRETEDLGDIITATAIRLNNVTHGDYECKEEPKVSEIKIRGFGEA